MSRTNVPALIALTAATLLSGPALAQEAHGTVTFTVQVTGVHNVPTPEGGHRNVAMNRTFHGKARLKLAGRSFAPTPTKGYDKASFEREKDACEQNSADEEAIASCQDEVQERQNAAERSAMSRSNPVTAALQAPKTEVWATEGCSGVLEISDKGTYRAIDEQDSVMREVPYTLQAKRDVIENAPGADGCAFSLLFDPHTQMARISVEAGPPRIQAVQRVGANTTTPHLNPFDWSAVTKFEKANIKVTGAQNGHSGVWNESTGTPMALSGATRAKGEVVQTVTRVTWNFTRSAQAAR